MIAEWHRNSDYQKAYDALEEEFQFYEEVIKARMRAGLTQEEVAQRMHTTKSAVSRLERGGGRHHHSPSLSTLRKYAHALGCRLEITFRPIQEDRQQDESEELPELMKDAEYRIRAKPIQKARKKRQQPSVVKV
jgi:transcriptional regulator with XRE-family HTH domain